MKSRTSRPKPRALRLHGTIARDLGVAIVSGKYQPGDILEGEIAASGQLSVSRTAYREAMRILAAKGLVESRPKVGTRVSPQDRWHLLDPDVLAWIFELEPDETLLHSLFELRRIMEPEAAVLACGRRTNADLESMDRALRSMAEFTLEAEAGLQADQDFHSALLRASHNAFIVSLTSGVCAAVAWITIFKQRDKPLQRDPVPDHRKVYDAIRANNPQAAHQAMVELVDLSLMDIMQLLRTKAMAKAAAR